MTGRRWRRSKVVVIFHCLYVLYQGKVWPSIGRISTYFELVSPLCSLCKYSIQNEQKIDWWQFLLFFMNICSGNPVNINLPIDCNIVKARPIIFYWVRPGLTYYSLKFPVDKKSRNRKYNLVHNIWLQFSVSQTLHLWGVLSSSGFDWYLMWFLTAEMCDKDIRVRAGEPATTLQWSRIPRWWRGCIVVALHDLQDNAVFPAMHLRILPIF